MRQETEFKYEVLASLGMGMFGEVSKVKRITDGKEFALKTLKLDMVQKNPRILNMLNHECSGLARKYHPNVVTLHDSFVIAEDNFMIYELCEPDSLKTRLRAEGPWNDEKIIELAKSMVLALDYLHGIGIIHRDIKPDNILVRDGQIKLADFGLCYRGSEHYDNDLIGSPAYLAPEIFKSRFYSEKSDVYALGVSLFEMCTGKFPFENRSEAALIKKKSEFIPTKELLINQSDYVIGLIQNMCHPKYEKRSTVTELLQYLQVDNSQIAETIKRGTREFDLGDGQREVQVSHIVQQQQPVYYQQQVYSAQQASYEPPVQAYPVQAQYQVIQPAFDTQKTFFSNTTQDNVISFARSREERQVQRPVAQRKDSDTMGSERMIQNSQGYQDGQQQASSLYNNLFSVNNFARVVRQDSMYTVDTTKAMYAGQVTAERFSGDEGVSQTEHNNMNMYSVGQQVASNRTIGSNQGDPRSRMQPQLHRTHTMESSRHAPGGFVSIGQNTNLLRGTTFHDNKSTRNIAMRGSATTRAFERAHSTEVTNKGLNFGQVAQGAFIRGGLLSKQDPQPLGIRKDYNNLFSADILNKAAKPPVYQTYRNGLNSISRLVQETSKPVYAQYRESECVNQIVKSPSSKQQEEFTPSTINSYSNEERVETPIITPVRSRNILPGDYNGQNFGMVVLNNHTDQAEAQQILNEISMMNDKMLMPAKQRTLRGGNLL